MVIILVSYTVRDRAKMDLSQRKKNKLKKQKKSTLALKTKKEQVEETKEINISIKNNNR